MALNPLTTLTTVADAAAEGGLDSTTFSGATTALYERKISAASAAVITWLGRGPLCYRQGIVEYPRGYGLPRIRLATSPVYQITMMTLDLGVPLVAETDFHLEQAGRTGIVFLKREVPFTGQSWPAIYPVPTVDTEQEDPKQISVTYDGGWVLPGQVALITPGGPIPVDAPLLPVEIGMAVAIAVATQIGMVGTDRTVKSESLMTERTDFDRTFGVNASNTSGRSALPGFPLESIQALIPFKRVIQF